jgi:2-polyprenyl-3-methyl-5-hydroxy-6-metoxy-1,4-benzoquinol methylase
MSRDYLDVEYSENVRPSTGYPSLLAAHLASKWNLSAGQTLLDVASGRAEMSAGFTSLGLKVTALDASPEAERYAIQAGADFISGFIRPDAPMPLAEASFDVIFCKSFIEHLREPISFAEDCFRVLKPGGKVLFLTPDWESNYRIFFDDVTHVTPFSTVTMQQLLELSGFESVTSYRFRQLPVTWRYPSMNMFSAAIAPFVPSRTTQKFLRWSRELMLCGVGWKPS